MMMMMMVVVVTRTVRSVEMRPLARAIARGSSTLGRRGYHGSVLRKDESLVHLSNFKLRDRDTGREVRYPDSPVFLAQRGTKAEEFARAVAQAGSTSTSDVSHLSEHERAWHTERSRSREPLGFGRYDIHSYDLKHDIRVMRFDCLEDTLKWLCETMANLETRMQDSVRDVTSVDNSDWNTLKSLGLINSKNEFVRAKDSSVWQGALPRVSCVKALKQFLEKIAEASSVDPSLKQIALPVPSNDFVTFNVGDLIEISGVVARVHDVDEIVLFHPIKDLSVVGVEERGVLSSILDFFKK